MEWNRLQEKKCRWRAEARWWWRLMVATVLFVLLVVLEEQARWLSNVYKDPLPTSASSESWSLCAGSQNDGLPFYELDHDDVSKYYIDPLTNVVPIGKTGQRWKPAHDRFYDCLPKILAKYKSTKSPEPKGSSYYRSQEKEDQYMYQNFFHSTASQARPHLFIELGALDGIHFSNSYFYDFDLGWGGVLIEGETSNYFQLEKNRGQDPAKNVTVSHLAICNHYQNIHLTGTGPMAKVGGTNDTGTTGRVTTVPCLPMHRALSMASLPYVDFYSIDVEGAELTVVTTHNFHQVPAHAVLVEMRPADEDTQDKTGNAKVRRALYARGFCRYDNRVGHNNEVWVNTTWNEKSIAALAAAGMAPTTASMSSR